MRFKVRAKTSSKLRVNGLVEYDCEPYRISLEPGDDGTVEQLGVSVEVEDYQKYLPSLRTVAGGPHHLSFRGGPFVDELIDLLQYLESIGSFWLELRKVGWEAPTYEWVPESAEEEAQLQVRSFGQQYGFQEPPRDYHPRFLAETLKDRETRSHLVVPFAFYREGINEHSQLRFIQAFFNFYFFLEGLFGEGKTKNYHVEQSFLASTPLVEASAKALKAIEDFRARRDHYSQIVEWLRRRDLDVSPEGVLRLLVRMRGDLHHFSIKRRKRVGHPLNQRQYETLSFLAMTICVNNVVYLMGSRDYRAGGSGSA